MADIPYDSKEVLQDFFERARKNYEIVMKEKTEFSEVFLFYY